MGACPAAGRRCAEHDEQLRACTCVRSAAGWPSGCPRSLASRDHPQRCSRTGCWRSAQVGWRRDTKTSRVSAVRVFLEEQWEDGLARMPRGAMIHAGEIPSADYRLPRGIEGPVFEQLIDPANLAMLPSEQHRTLILLLAFTGLRVSSIVTLARDALEIGSDGHPYLRYLNVKLRREAVIPIGPALHEQLRRQEQLPDRHARCRRHPLPVALAAGGSPRQRHAASITCRSAGSVTCSSATCAQRRSATARGSWRAGYIRTGSATISAPAWSTRESRCR